MFAAKGRAWLVGVFLGASAVNALVAVLESRGLFRPFTLETFGGRQDTGAYAGNVGYLAITLALASVLALGSCSKRAGLSCGSSPAALCRSTLSR